MSITSLTSNNKTSLPIVKIIWYVVGGVGIFLVGYFAREVGKTTEALKSKSALVAESYSSEAEVFVNGISLGTTPLKSQDIKPGENSVKLKSGTREYETTIDFMANKGNILHEAVISRDLGISDAFSSGVNVWLEKGTAGSVLRVISEPDNAMVYIDNNEQGKTPFSTDKLTEGQYDLRIDAVGYETQTFRINIKKGYTLNVNFKLFPVPTTPRPKLFDGSANLYDLSIDNLGVTSDTQDWARAVVYWNKTRGISLDGVGLNKEPLFDFFLDYKGNLFDANGNVIIEKADADKVKDAKKGGYLGRVADGTGLSKEAKTTYLLITGGSISGKKATIKETGTGWLRVRSVAGINGLEVAKVNVTQVYPVLEQVTGWVKIKVSDTVSGWVSADYVTVAE